MYLVVRLVLFFASALLYFFVVMKGKIPFLLIEKRMKIIFFALLALNIFVYLVPVENAVIRFQTPEQAFRYAYPYDAVDDMISNDDHAIIVHTRRENLARTFLCKDQRGWQVPNAYFINDFPVILKDSHAIQYRRDHGTLCLLVNTSWLNDNKHNYRQLRYDIQSF